MIKLHITVHLPHLRWVIMKVHFNWYLHPHLYALGATVFARIDPIWPDIVRGD